MHMCIDSTVSVQALHNGLPTMLLCMCSKVVDVQLEAVVAYMPMCPRVHEINQEPQLVRLRTALYKCTEDESVCIYFVSC